MLKLHDKKQTFVLFMYSLFYEKHRERTDTVITYMYIPNSNDQLWKLKTTNIILGVTRLLVSFQYWHTDPSFKGNTCCVTNDIVT